MTDTPKQIAVFDINGTLLHDNIGVLFIRHLFRRGKLPLLTMLLISFIYPLVKLRLLSFRYAILLGIWGVAGMTEQEAEQEAQLCFDAVMKPKLLQDGLKEIAHCQQRGIPIILATGSQISIAKIFQKHVQADELIAATTQLDSNGRFSMRAQKPLPFKTGKRDLVLALKNKKAPQSKMTVYSDTIKDTALLEAADHPIAVNATTEFSAWVKSQNGSVRHFK
ncbi:MAG: haloacid dehalogenase-like hydrolase [Magnetococcales bacterium]|nr:haloacid dehalogenase-like hydrolase [Magnetococcales bacterium]